jgi:hypothetical protein
VGRNRGHQWGETTAASGEIQWPPTGSFPWPPSHCDGVAPPLMIGVLAVAFLVLDYLVLPLYYRVTGSDGTEKAPSASPREPP